VYVDLMEQVVDGVYRLGSRWVNFYLLDEAGALTLIDTGLPGYKAQLPAALTELGRRPADVKAIVLTHTHSDHIGAVDVFARATGASVYVPRGEASIATGDAKGATPKGVVAGLRHKTMWSFVRHLLANKGLARVTVPEVTAFDPGDALEVPGRLRVVGTPGHSPAHCSLLHETAGVLFCGDALATLAVDDGSTGPRLHPFNEDRARAIASLEALESVSAGVLAPGHGEPWHGQVSDAVERARTILRSR
jgi:glyoxylase-like metal-dependent hydrolase (beta-lactamase superfamily II)